MAAHAATEMNCDVTILSRKQKSPLYGAQYLHAPIPGITDRDHCVEIEYRLIGDVTAYRRKVYGPQWDGTVSPEDLDEQHVAWDIRQTYDDLWTSYHHLIEDVELDPAGLKFTTDNLAGVDGLIINSVPLRAFCHQGHQFRAQEVVAAGDAPALGIDVGTIYHSPPDTVICNGEEMPTWYRLSRIFDHTTVEWPMGFKPPLSSAAKVIKPLSHNCDCWPDMINVGRYGSWEKGVLSHTAYFKTLEVLNGKAAQAARYTDPDMPTLF
jgi:hypothetical protein